MLRSVSGLCLAAMFLFGANGIAVAQYKVPISRAKQLYDDGKFKRFGGAAERVFELASRGRHGARGTRR